MKGKILSLGAVAVLLLVGAGCAQVESPALEKQATEPVVQNTTDGTTVETVVSDDSITLSAVPTAIPGEVLLTWNVPTELESPEGYRLVRSANVEPRFPGSFWFHQGQERRHITWINVPAGRQYFRLCQFKGGECVAYSNQVSVNLGENANSTASPYTTKRTEVEVIRNFYNALMSDNKADALKYVPASVRSADFFKQKWEEIQDWQFQNVEIRLDTITGDIFIIKKVDIVVGVKVDGKIVAGPRQVTVDFRNDKWYIVDFQL